MISIHKEIELKILEVKQTINESIPKQQTITALEELWKTINNRIEEYPIVISSDEESRSSSPVDNGIKNLEKRTVMLERQNKREKQLLWKFQRQKNNQRSINKKLLKENRAIKKLNKIINEEFQQLRDHVQQLKRDFDDLDGYAISRNIEFKEELENT